MSADASSTTIGIFCRKCGYDLRATAENRCPECGTDFDRQQRQTYDLRPRSPLRKWAWRLSVLTLAVVLTLSGMIWWTWRGFERDRLARERLAKFGIVRKELAAMPVIEKILPEKWQYLRTRVWSLCLGTEKMTQEDWAAAEQLPYVRDGRFSSVHPGDPAVSHIQNMQHLTDLFISAQLIGEPNGLQLRSLPEVRFMQLGGAMTDEGIANIKSMKSLQRLVLFEAHLTDDQLLSFADLQSLREISILERAPQITQNAIDKLKARRADLVVTTKKI